jgi:hypothetical protein
VTTTADKVGPDTSVETQGAFDGLTFAGIFSGIGLLISLIMFLDQILPELRSHALTDRSIVSTMSLDEISAKVDVNKLPDLEFEDMSLVFSTPAKR